MESATASQLYNFAVEVPSRRPRAWERAPKSPIKSHRHGKKVWKRFETRPKEATQTQSNFEIQEAAQGSEVIVNTPSRRPVKRLRNAPEHKVKEGAPAVNHFTATLREKAPGTPKRKTARRKSLKPDRIRKAIIKQKPIENVSFDTSLPDSSPSKAPTDLERSDLRSQPDFAVVIRSPAMGKKEAKEDDSRARDGPYAEGSEEALENTASPATQRSSTEASQQQEGVPTEDITGGLASGAPESNDNQAIEAASEETAHLVEPEELETSHEPPIDDKEIKIRLPSETSTPLTAITKPIFVFGSTVNPGVVVSPKSPSIQQEQLVTESMSVPQSVLQTPHSNSLQDKLHKTRKSTGSLSIPGDSSAEPLSPVQHAINKLNIAAVKLVNRDGLASEEVDGLSSHREAIPHGFEQRDDVSTPHEDAHCLDIENQEAAALSMDASKVVLSVPGMRATRGNIEAGNCAESEELDQGASTVLPTAMFLTEASEPNGSVLWDETRNVQSPSGECKGEAEQAGSYKDQGREKSVVQGVLRPTEGNGDGALASGSQDNQDDGICEYAAIAPEPKSNREAIAAMPVKTTRSGARFSDDTNLLKDFLNRAQAKKMVKDIKKPANAPPPVSPRRSPRKALTELTSNSPSPQKPKDLANRPGTPPGKQRLDAFSFDDVDELTEEPTSCRRSTRTRLPAPAKAPPGAPSFIPVRRADGTDAVVLQKSMAQELAVQTRANTRRNKGQSKPPSLALQNLTAETVEMSSTRMHAHENSKSVGWDERLVYYSQPNHPNAAEEEGKEEKEEKRPKGRRLRGLGAANRTAGSRRVAEVMIPSGTPAPRRRGKFR